MAVFLYQVYCVNMNKHNWFVSSTNWSCWHCTNTSR